MSQNKLQYTGTPFLSLCLSFFFAQVEVPGWVVRRGRSQVRRQPKSLVFFFYILLSHRILFGYLATAYRIKCFLTCTLQKNIDIFFQVFPKLLTKVFFIITAADIVTLKFFEMHTSSSALDSSSEMFQRKKTQRESNIKPHITIFLFDYFSIVSIFFFCLSR